MNWKDRAECRATPWAWWEVGGASRPGPAARELCGRCPVVAECAVDALETKTGHGIVRAGVVCRRGTRAQREATEDALEIAATPALFARKWLDGPDGRPIRPGPSGVNRGMTHG